MKNKLVIIALIILSVSCKKETKKVTENHLKDGKHCFISVVENHVIKDNDTILEKDNLLINIIIDGNKVNGSYDFIPFKSEANKGTFVGFLEENIATTKYTHTLNGKKSTEEVIFKIEANKISILGGEKIEKDGIQVFKDKSKGIYMIDIPRVNCD
jgi:hypothetical protein